MKMKMTALRAYELRSMRARQLIGGVAAVIAAQRRSFSFPAAAQRRSCSWLRASLIVAVTSAVLAGCGSAPKRGGYYQDDGPPPDAPANVAKTPDAVPRVEPFHPYANRPYSVLGRRYVPMTEDRPYRSRGLASWYGRQFHGSRTSSGETYNMFAMSAAHTTLPIPSYARVTNVKNGASVVVRVNDRGPFKRDRVIDVSYAAAVKLGIVASGTGEVEVVRLTFNEIRSAFEGEAAPPVAAAAPVQ
jgi:rare lipoprotein A